MRDKLLAHYDEFPFQEHPLWLAIQRHELSLDEILCAETQHYIRTRAGQDLRRAALSMADGRNGKLFALLLDTYLEECTEDVSGPSHLELIRRFLIGNGVSQDELEKAKPTPGNAAAMALYRDITSRGSACHMIGAGAVEHYYSILSPKIFKAYTALYGIEPTLAETYRLHGPMDKTHADRAFAILEEAVEAHGWEVIDQSVRDAFVATSLHYDGMLQAATGATNYWSGKK
jgi:pyrroloquinoline quinone (PQQ) biosynthesis protein C